ncbi:hypothetical protein KKC65_03540 [Patescibacteria group bacterium]|nr:hypothetical protein [Patescibacteria group bacterium]
MIYIRKRVSQGRHNLGVASFARKVVSAGWNKVWSDLPGNTKPPIINGFIPDIYATHTNGRRHLVEIETIDSINTRHALQQKAAFQAWVNASPRTRSFKIKLV